MRLIESIKIDKANLNHIAETGKINGTLLSEIKRIAKAYAGKGLFKYSQFLEDTGYIDSDWREEKPDAVERFLKIHSEYFEANKSLEEEVEKLKTEIQVQKAQRRIAENRLEYFKKFITNELVEIPKHQDFASRHGDAEGYARGCGQLVLLERIVKKFK